MIESEQKFEKETVSAENLVAGFIKRELSPKLKSYLESVCLAKSGDFTAGNKLAEKVSVLRKISSVTVEMPRTLNDDEKEFLFKCFKKTIEEGEPAQNIGFDDRFAAKLTAGKAGVPLNEKEKALNGEILRFIDNLEEKNGFFEETAAKIIQVDTSYVDTLINKCNILIEKDKYPKGVVFASALVDLKQTKSALKILAALAQKGQATEMASLIHRFLPLTKGAENLLLNVLKINLAQQKQKSKSNSVVIFREYIAKLYLQAARSFAENQHFDMATTLLSLLVDGQWVDADSAVLDDFAALSNAIMIKNPQSAGLLTAGGKKLGLNMQKEGGQMLLCVPGEASYKAARCRLEQTIIGIDSIDVAKFTDKGNAVPDVPKAEEKKSEPLKQTTEESLNDKEKTSINNVIENKIKEADKHLSKLKQATVSAIKVAGEQAVKVKQKVADVAQIHKEMPAKEELKEEKNISQAEEISPIKETVAVVEPLVEEEIKLDDLLADENVALLPDEEKVEAVEPIKEDKAANLPAIEPVSAKDVPDLSAFIETQTTAEEKPVEQIADNAAEAVENKEPQSAPVMEELQPLESVVAEIMKQPESVATEEPKPQAVKSSFYEVPFWEDNETTATDLDLAVEMATNKQEQPQKVVSTFYERPFWEEEPTENTTQEATPEITSEPSASDNFAPQAEPEKIDAPEDNVAAIPEESAPVEEKPLYPAEFEKHKANVEGIMNVHPEELDDQLNKIRQTASDAVHKAGETVSLIKKKVADTNITSSSSVNKIRQLAQKIKLFKK